ncbi:MAG: T9SS type A sorting domain-containing protein [Cyclobacteriaceae bacterium]
MNKTTFTTVLLAMLCLGSYAQNVTIPDANFKAYLVGNTAINTNEDSEIQVSEASAFNGTISCSNKSISDLTGIEAFTSLTGLYCNQNNLTALDVSQNTQLTDLQCLYNNLTALDVSNNTSLELLWCHTNNLTTLDVSNNTSLSSLVCYNNSLTTLTLGNNLSLTTLNCRNNNLTLLDVSQCPNLTSIGCKVNNLTALDVSQNALLTTIECSSNNIGALDVSNSPGLTYLKCHNNSLTALNMKNVSTTTLTNFDATANPNLTCIEVDDVAAAEAAWTNIDTAASFRLSCGPINIPDANFKAYLVGNTAINTNEDSEIQVSEASAFNGTISCSSNSISDLTGIEAFVNLSILRCEYNSLSSLDLSQNTALTEVYLTNNNLTTLNVSQCTALTFLKFQGNNISTIDLSNNTALTDLYCNYNDLSTIDLSQNTALTFLAFNGNLFSSIDLSQNTAIEALFSGDNPNLTSLDLSNNTALTTLTGNFVSQGNMSTLTLGQNSNLNIVSCENCGLTSLDVSQNPNITFLGISGNSISTIDLSTNTALTNINLNYNSLTALDLSSNTNLSTIQCANNFNLSALNLKNVDTSANLFATGNPNLTCIEVDDVTAAEISWTNIDGAASFSLDCTILVNAITVQGQAGATTITTDGGTLQMEASILPADADDATYTWSLENGTGEATIDTNGLLTAVSNGTVTVTATANDGSGVSGDAVITISNQIVLGINDQSSIGDLFIFPNPVSAELNIDFYEAIEFVTIVDVMGRSVKTIYSPENSLDVSDLTKGIYFLQVKTDQGIISKKFLKL